MTRYYSAAETAKFVRQALKEQFPGVKFSVRSETYSMGSSVHVRWTDGPATNAVTRVLAQFQGRGMTDNTDYTPHQTRLHNGQEVMFSSYVTHQRDYSPALMQRIGNRVAARYGLDPVPQWGERGWSHDPNLSTSGYADWFSQRVWQECERTHCVSTAEMQGYIAPPLPINPVIAEY